MLSVWKQVTGSQFTKVEGFGVSSDEFVRLIATERCEA